MALLDAWLRNREVMAMIGHTDGVRSASFSPDGKRVVTASDEHDGAGLGRDERADAGFHRARRPHRPGQ